MNILHTLQRAMQIKNSSNSKKFKNFRSPKLPHPRHIKHRKYYNEANTERGEPTPRMCTTCKAPNPPLTQTLRRRNSERHAPRCSPKI